MGDRPGSSSRVRTSEDKVRRKDLYWSVRIVLKSYRAARRKRAQTRGVVTLHATSRRSSSSCCSRSSPSPPVATRSFGEARAKYYSMQWFVATTGEPASNWTRRHDERYFHYSLGLQAVVMALGACDEVSLFGFGKPVRTKHHYHSNQKKELDRHDYEAKYQFYHDLQMRPEAVPFLDEAQSFKLPPVKMYW